MRTVTPTPKGEGFPVGIITSKGVGATAKFLPLCKAVSSRSFNQLIKLQLEEPLEVGGNTHSQIHGCPRQNPAYRCSEASNAKALLAFVFGQVSRYGAPYRCTEYPTHGGILCVIYSVQCNILHGLMRWLGGQYLFFLRCCRFSSFPCRGSASRRRRLFCLLSSQLWLF